jgi:hypothetical protein
VLVLTERVTTETFKDVDPTPAPPTEGLRKYVQPFTNTMLVTIPGATHGLGTADLLVQCYDAQTPRQPLTAGWSVHASTYEVLVHFSQLQTGRVVLVG